MRHVLIFFSVLCICVAAEIRHKGGAVVTGRPKSIQVEMFLVFEVLEYDFRPGYEIRCYRTPDVSVSLTNWQEFVRIVVTMPGTNAAEFFQVEARKP